MAIPSRRWDVSTRKSRCEEKKVQVHDRAVRFSRAFAGASRA
jgi:hypothetical protein